MGDNRRKAGAERRTKGREAGEGGGGAVIQLKLNGGTLELGADSSACTSTTTAHTNNGSHAETKDEEATCTRPVILWRVVLCELSGQLSRCTARN